MRASQRERPAESSGRPGEEHSGAGMPVNVTAVQKLVQQIAKGAAIAAFAFALVLALPVGSCPVCVYLRLALNS